MLRYMLRLVALAIAFTLAWVGMGLPPADRWVGNWQSYGECVQAACQEQAAGASPRHCQPPSEEGWWLCLGGAAVALLTATWPQRKGDQETTTGHNVRILAALLLTAAVLLGLQLLRLQIYRAPQIGQQVAYLDPANCRDDVVDPRPGRAEMRTRRGRIYDRDGTLLADIQVTADGWVRRTYPRDDLGYIVGFYNPRYGNYALEATYDDYLAGRVSANPEAAFIEELLHHPHQGDDLYLTLDMGLQETADAAYRQVTQEVMGDECPEGRCPGSVVLLDARSGAILAMVSYPRFDPRPMVFDPAAPDWAAETDRVTAYWESLRTSAEDLLVHRAISGLYPPGSTFKTLTAAVALETGLVTPETVITCPNHYTVTGHIVVNAVENLAQRYMKKQNLIEDYQWSCNTAFAQIGLMIGAERYSEYARKFGLVYADQDPPQPALFTDLPGAISTIAHDRSFLDIPTAMADTGYGQGELQITPLYMAMLAQTIANDGTMMKPYIVDRAVDPAGNVLYQAQPTPLRVPIGAPTARTMRALMVNAVENGYGWRAKIEGVLVGGKTGTAEVPGGKPHAWFIALAPADKPRFVVAILVEHGEYGSTIAAPIAKIVLEAALQQP
jgi:peptidoglycan glycosyltransferase